MPKRDANYMSARREKIVDAALAVMNREGSAALSTPALCREAGISTGALYTHFKSKDDVYEAVAERALRRRQEDFDFHDAQELSARVTGLATICREPPEIEKPRGVNWSAASPDWSGSENSGVTLTRPPPLSRSMA